MENNLSPDSGYPFDAKYPAALDGSGNRVGADGVGQLTGGEDRGAFRGQCLAAFGAVRG